jgi:pyridoxine/pyridoxamine 5'-phosphate oxidase
MDAKNLADLYDLAPLDWADCEAALAAGYTQAPDTGGPNRHSTWVATIDADGSPHMNGIGSLWLDGCFYFETGRTSRKGRNLERDPRCTLSLALHDFDVVVEGAAELVTDPALVADIAARYRAEGWPAEVDETGTALTAEFSAPSAGSPPWHVYRVVPKTATVVATVEPGGATRFDF